MDSSLEQENLPESPLPSRRAELRVAVVRPSWHGLEHIRSFVVFGDSYSASLDSESNECASDSGKWIDHLVMALGATMSSACPRLYNYAIPGATIEDDLSSELATFFSAFPRKVTPTSQPSFNPVETLYVLWLGINDCGCTSADELEDVVEILFDAMHELYVKAGARNFLLVDVPPLDRSPGALEVTINLNKTCDTWNDLLRSYSNVFSAESTQATVLLFSAHAVLTGVLDDPFEFDFDQRDVEDAGGAIWVDELHLITTVHSIISERLQRVLGFPVSSV